MSGAGLASASAVPAWECDNQRQDLIAFGFGNAHPPAKNAGRVGQPPEEGRPQALKRGDNGTLIGTTEGVPFRVADVRRLIAETPRFARRADEGVRPYTD